MPPDFYKVEVIHFLNPHLIWVEVCDPSVTVEYKFEQVGIYGILPQDKSLDIVAEELTIQKCDAWPPAASKILKDILHDSTDVWFSPTHIDRRSSIFDDNIHKYGDLIIKYKNDKFKKVSKMIVQTNFAYFDIGEFHQKLSTGNIKTKLSSIKVQQVVAEIKRYYAKNAQKKKALMQQTSVFQMSQEFESSLTITNVERHNNKLVQKLLKDKAKDFELCKEVDEESIGCGSKYKSRKNNTELSNSSSQNDVYNKSFNNLKKVLNEAMKDEKTTVKDEDIKGGLLNKRMNLINMLNQKKSKQTSDDDKSTEYNKGNQSEGASSKEMDAHKTHKATEAFDNNAKIEKETKYNKVNGSDRPIPGRFKKMDIQKSCNKVVSFDNSCTMQTAITNPKFLKKPEISKENAKSKHVSYGPAGLDIKYFKIEEWSGETNKRNDETDNTVKEIDFDKVFMDNAAQLDAIQTEKNTLNDYFTQLNKTTEVKHKEKEEHAKNEESDSRQISKSSGSMLKRKLKTLQDLLTNKRSSCDTSNKDESVIEKNADSDEDTDEVLEKLITKYQCNSVVEKKTTKNIPNEVKLKANVNPFKNIDPNISVFVDKLVTPVLMVHSKMNKRIQPVHTMRDINFNDHIHNILKNMSIECPMMLQTVSWSIILRGYSLFLISSLNSGKTVGYLPAVCRLVSDSTPDNDGNGPIAIIICATAKSVANVEEMAKMFLGAEVPVLACYPGVDDLFITTTLLNGCDLLISTPSFLFRLLQLTDFGVDLRRLSIFVLDDCERLFDIYADEVKFFQIKIKEMLKKRTNRNAKVQYVVASRTWFDGMESLALKAPNTVICIGGFQECVLYSKTNVSVSLVKSKVKLNNVLDFLEQIDKSTKTVIVCNSDDEVNLLEHVLKISKHMVFACNNKMTIQDLYSLSASWSECEDPVTGPILVCCDGNLTHMNVTDAHNLIQYSLPDLYSLFCKRFSVLNDNYPSIFKKDTNKVKIKIFVEESNTEQLPKIINFIKRCADVPEVLDKVCKNNLIDKDILRAKNFVPLCNSFLRLGRCPDIFNCQERHTILKDYDTPLEWMPKEGFVTFKILHYHSATLYSGRLLSNIVDGKITKVPQTFNDLSIKMGLYYCKESNRKLHGIPKVGDVCAVSIKTNFYVRCLVVKIVSTYDRGDPNNVLIKLIDEEWFEVTRDIYLFHLPNELKSIQTRVALIRLANLAPKDNDIAFSNLAKNHIKEIIDSDEDVFLRGHIALTVGNCIFVDTLKVCQDLKSLDETVEKHNIKFELLKGYAILNEELIPYFRKLCVDSGVSVETKEKVLEKEIVEQIATKENVLKTRMTTNVLPLDTLPIKSDDIEKEEVLASNMTEETNPEILNKSVQLEGIKTQDKDEIAEHSNINNLPSNDIPMESNEIVINNRSKGTESSLQNNKVGTKENVLTTEISDKQLFQIEKSVNDEEDLVKSDNEISKPLITQDLETSDLSGCNIEGQLTETTNVLPLDTLSIKSDDIEKKEESNMTEETNLEILNKSVQLEGIKTQDKDEIAEHSNINNLPSNDIPMESNEIVINNRSKGTWSSLQNNEVGTKENVLTTEISDKQLFQIEKSVNDEEDLVKSDNEISKPLITQDLETSDLSGCNIEGQLTETTNVLPLDTLSIKSDDIEKEEVSNMTKETNLEILNKNAQFEGNKTEDKDEIAQHSNINNLPSNDIPMESNETVINNRSKGTWSSLQNNEMACVYLAYSNSPDKFFLRHQESASSMTSLLSDIKKYISNLINKEVCINEGEFILAKYPDDSTYERARIVSVDNDKVKCFFLDQGDAMELSKDHLLPITEEIIDKLPFQAIECRLLGVKPVNGEWNKSTNDWFCDYCYENTNGKLKELFVKYYTKEPAEYTDDFKFGVVLFDTNSDKDIIINQIMIDLDLALENNDEAQFFKDVDSNLASYEETKTELTTMDSQTSSLLLPQTQPNRTFPLVGSDESDDEKWDVNIGEDFLKIMKSSLKVPENLLKEKGNSEKIKISNLENISKSNQTTESLDSVELTSSETVQHKVPVKNIDLNNEVRRPKLLWRQNKSIVTVSILIDVDNYNLEINSKSLKFSAFLNDTKYEFDYELYGVVDKDKSSHGKKHLCVLVKLVKILEKNWLSLTREGIKHAISYDVSTIDTSSDEDEINDSDLAKCLIRKPSDDSESDADAPDDLN